MICLHLVVIALFVVEWYVNFKLMSPTIIFFVYLRRDAQSCVCVGETFPLGFYR